MQRTIFIISFLLSINFSVHAQAELKFSRLDSLFAYAERNSAAIKTGEQQAILAKWQKVAALANTVNFRNQVSFALTDNTRLPVNFLPAEAFGGPPGTFREIQFGQQYIGNAAIVPQIDIINPSSWEKVKSAGISKELTGINNLVIKRSLYESIAAAYYNIISLQEQTRLTKENLLKADTLLLMVQNKFAQGLVRQQDVNDAAASKLSLDEKLNQAQLSLEQQQLSVKILCDLPENSNVVIEEVLDYNASFPASRQASSQLQYKSSALQLGMAKSDLRYNRLSQLPSLSLFLNYAWQQNSNDMFFDSQADWIYSQFIGARLTFSIPDINKMFLTQNARINYKIALHNLEHAKVQEEAANRQLQLDYQKAYSQLSTNKRIFELKNENYLMAFNQYEQAVLPFDKLLLAFTEMQNSRLNYVNAAANLHYQKTKIDLTTLNK